jgi:hypothetical protein
MQSLWAFSPEQRQKRLRQLEREFCANPRPVVSSNRVCATETLRVMGDARVHPLIELELFSAVGGGVHRYPHWLRFCSYVDIDLVDHSRHAVIYVTARLFGERSVRFVPALHEARPLTSLAMRIYTANTRPPTQAELFEMSDVHREFYRPNLVEARRSWDVMQAFFRPAHTLAAAAFNIVNNNNEVSKLTVFLVMLRAAVRLEVLQEFILRTLPASGVGNRRACAKLAALVVDLKIERCRAECLQYVTHYRYPISRYCFSPLGTE